MIRFGKETGQYPEIRPRRGVAAARDLEGHVATVREAAR